MEYYKSYDEIISAAKSVPEKSVMAIAFPDAHSIEAALMAADDGIIEPVLVGNAEEAKKILKEMGRDSDGIRIVEAEDDVDSAAKAVELVRKGEANFLLKGKLDTKVILKAVVNKETGLGTGRIMSHFSLFEMPNYHKLVAIVDGGMMTYPDLAQKADIIRNTVSVFKALGYECPKVGVLACVEKLNPKMPETVEGDELKQMNQRGEIVDCIVEGPISYDCALSKEIADFKGFDSPCAGDCDILIVPNIHAGNLVGKAITITAGGKMAGFIVGAKCPIALTSRGSTVEEKYTSIVLAALTAKGLQEELK